MSFLIKKIQNSFEIEDPNSHFKLQLGENFILDWVVWNFGSYTNLNPREQESFLDSNEIIYEISIEPTKRISFDSQYKSKKIMIAVDKQIGQQIENQNWKKFD